MTFALGQSVRLLRQPTEYSVGLSTATVAKLPAGTVGQIAEEDTGGKWIRICFPVVGRPFLFPRTIVEPIGFSDMEEL